MSLTREVLHYAKRGEKQPPVVFLHGIVGSHRYWDVLATRLAGTHTTLAIDLLGFGESPKPKDADYSMEDHIESIHCTLEDTDIRSPFILVGHSMGALLALRYAVTYPSAVKKLVLCSIPLFSDQQEAHRALKYSGTVPNMMVGGPIARISCALMCAFRPVAQRLAPLYYKDVPKQVAVDGTKHIWQSYSRSLGNIIVRENAADDMRRLKMPATVIMGEHDRLASQAQLKRVPESIECIVVKNASHNLPLEQPEIIVQQIAEMVTSTAARHLSAPGRAQSRAIATLR